MTVFRRRAAAPHSRLEPRRDDSWLDHAACRTDGRQLFFEPDRENATRRDRRIRAAKSVCAECPVNRECLAYALAADERHGIWGGLTSRERARVGRAPSASR